MRHPEVINIIILTAIAVMISGLFIAYGGVILFSDEAPISVLAFALLTSLYGIASLSLLIWSWIGGGQKAVTVSKISSISYFSICVIGSLYVGILIGEDVGVLIGEGIQVIFGIAFLLSINWLIVSKVALWRLHA